MATNPDKTTGSEREQGNRDQSNWSTEQSRDARHRTDFGRKEDFGDDYEVKQEDGMTEDEARSEKGNRPGNQPDRR
ncbi:hypothetical protein V9K67_23435 [Paraflavisolibacter sp. H34]|uniref:hypothetical protein n=1 Tax=Huijunlia imazamoxiresistens TaxID=3127457 RepID=UPI00301A464D